MSIACGAVCPEAEADGVRVLCTQDPHDRGDHSGPIPGTDGRHSWPAVSERPTAEALHAAAGALMKARHISVYNPNDPQISDAMEMGDWCLECVGTVAAAMVAAKLVVEAVWPLAVQAGREAAARDIEAVPWHDEGLPTALAAAEMARGE